MKLFQTVFTLGLAIFSLLQSVDAQTPYLGQIIYVGFNFCPSGWEAANGQLLSIAQNSALFALIGVYYGGDGLNTFALPDLRGRVPIHNGQGSGGLSDYVIGGIEGVESVTLTTSQMPSHNHGLLVSDTAAYRSKPVAGSLFGAQCNAKGFLDNTTPNIVLGSSSISATGGSQPHENRQPLLVLNACIALQGIFPSQD